MSTTHEHAQLHALSHFAASNANQLILLNPIFNKDTAFTKEERDRFNLHGLLPPTIETIEQQSERCMLQLRAQTSPLAKNVFLDALRNRNETLFHHVIATHFEECAPLVYTPTVGQACVQFSLQLRDHSGLFVSKHDAGRVARVLDAWRRPHVDIIVVTDGSRILGLGDLGANGMGIPVGKLILYTAAAGFHPSATLPITLDVGCNADAIRNDARYVGVRERRTLDDAAYHALLDEFMDAVYRKWPGVLVQFEDFSNDHCFELLARYRERYLCFNDDIQGTGAVVAAGIVNAWRATGLKPADTRFVFLGAGAAGVGVAQQIVDILVLAHGVERAAAARQFWFVDSRGVVATARDDKLEAHKQVFARHDLAADALAQMKTLQQVVEHVKPHALIGLSGMGGAFTAPLLRLMGELNERPIIMALSNPTDNSECSARDAYENTGGRAIFASGSPFEPVRLGGGGVVEVTRTPGQANNMYVFPALGFAASLCAAKRVTDRMVATAVTALAATVTDAQIGAGLLYPALSDIRDVTARVACAIIECAVKDGEARRDVPAGKQQLEQFVKQSMYVPQYATSDTAKL